MHTLMQNPIFGLSGNISFRFSIRFLQEITSLLMRERSFWQMYLLAWGNPRGHPCSTMPFKVDRDSCDE